VADGIAGHGAPNAGFTLHDRAHEPTAPLSAAGRAFHDRFVAAVDDDLDLPTALAVVRAVLRADLAADERRWLVLDADLVLGLRLHLVWTAAGTTAVPADVKARLAARAEARAAGDYAAADTIRAMLESDGWEVLDAAGGSTARRRGSV
jgi:cysteinyl-tRNA synthetase